MHSNIPIIVIKIIKTLIILINFSKILTRVSSSICTNIKIIGIKVVHIVLSIVLNCGS